MSSISQLLEQQILADAGHRCGYCLTDERYTGIPLSIEHLIPESRGGETVRANLWRSCRPCNEFKGARTDALDPISGEIVALYNPRIQPWNLHFEWNETGTFIQGVTPNGRATVDALQMNRSLIVSARTRWVVAGWHPPPREDE